MSDTTVKPLVSNRTYDILKPIVTIWLPGISALYFTLAQIWGLPNAEEVVGTIAAITVFLGLFVGVSSKKYNASDAKYSGHLVEIHEGDMAGMMAVQLDITPEQLKQQKDVTFRVH